MEQVILIIFYVITLVYSIILHEISHGVVALWLGDKTAKYAGRLSLEPLRHIDPIGSIILPFFMILTTGFAFGWAKPVPYNPYNLKWPKWGGVVVAFAGPITNLAIAMFAAIAGSFINVPVAQKYTIVEYLLTAQWGSLVHVVVGFPLLIIYVICAMIIFWNILLGTFNLIPIPPLDGSKLIFAIFNIPQKAQVFLEQWGFFILIFILFTPIAIPFQILLKVLWDVFFAISLYKIINKNIMHDILIKNGTIVDGTGEKKFKADIAINDAIITEIGDMSGDSAHEVIDANDYIVAPGFIDISNRSDTRWRLFKDPALESMLYQGVTTIIGGNSGSSLAPIYSENMLKSTRKWIDVSSINIDWQSMGDFFETLEKYKTSINFGTFVGYGTLRRGLVGDVNRDLNKNEEISIKKHIEESLDQGALGVSTGMIYSHERNIKTNELINLAKIIAKKNKLFVAHLRDEGANLMESVEEVLYIQKKSGVRIHISHLKATHKEHWSDMQKVVEKIEKTNILFDVYPYTFSTTVLYTLLPSWVSDGGRRMLLERLRNKDLRERLVKEMDDGVDLSHAMVAHTMRSDYFCGKTFAQIAKLQNTSVNEAVIDVLLASSGQVNIFLESISKENITRGLKSKNSIISSNGIGYTIQKRNECMEHPRSFGAFPRIFDKYVKQDKILSIEDAVYKMTGKVANELLLKQRGVLKEGNIADIVIFDEDKFQDKSTIEQPYRYANGVEGLIVNGQVVLKYNKYTGLRPGQIIK